MKYMEGEKKEMAETYDFTSDFSNLSKKERRFILKTVETLVKVQQKNDEILNPSQIKNKKEELT